MRIYLDGAVRLWLRKAFSGPYAYEDEEDRQWWLRIDKLLGSDSHGSYIEFSETDPNLLAWFVRELVLKGWGRTYGPAFRKLAKKIDEHLGASIIDKLGDLVRGKPKTTVKFGKTRRGKAIDEIHRRRGG